jgi:hypothetical protein
VVDAEYALGLWSPLKEAKGRFVTKRLRGETRVGGASRPSLAERLVPRSLLGSNHSRSPGRLRHPSHNSHTASRQQFTGEGSSDRTESLTKIASARSMAGSLPSCMGGGGVSVTSVPG